jgi:DNA-directed RNA polymerase specialized sigma24 family protein
MPPADDDPPSGDDPKDPPVPAGVVRAFLSSPQAFEIATNVIRPIVPEGEVEELVGDALTEALVAPPPSKKEVLPGWLATIARRKAADWLRKNKRRKPYQGAMPTQVEGEDDYTGHADDRVEPGELAYDPESDEEPGDMLGGYLDRLVGDDARDREVRGWIHDKAEGKKTYAAIAKDAGLTEAQVAQRIHRFKVKYAPRVKKRQRMLLWLKIAAGIAVAAAIAIAWALWPAPPKPETIERDPAALPLPSATASGFPQAMPTPQPSTSASSEPPPEKPPLERK